MDVEETDLVIRDDEVAFEEELVRSPYALRTWLDYVASKKGAPAKARFQLYERALKNLPGSYKLWRAYIAERTSHVSLTPGTLSAALARPSCYPLKCRGRNPFDPKVSAMNSVFERALVFMHKMPTIWVEFLKFLAPQRRITSTRHAFDRSLQALPVTQHERVWPLYIQVL